VRQPNARGAVVDAARIDVWRDRFQGYRVAVTRDRINAWLDRFAAQDRDLAARILDAVEYISPHDLENALTVALGNLAALGWRKNGRAGRWRFVPFTRRTAESGDAVLYHFRVANRLTAARYDELFISKRDLLEQNLGPEDTVVFVDDISGSGEQAIGNWAVLRELLPRSPRVFLILVVSSTAAKARIEGETKLRVLHHIELTDADRVFSTHCGHFTRHEKERILHYCRRADHHLPYGWGACGFVVVFAHRCPNNSIPILHARNRSWTGLFER